MFLEFMQNILNKCNNLLGVEHGLIFKNDDNLNIVLYTYSIGSNEYSLGLCSDSSEWLLYRLADTVNEHINEIIGEQGELCEDFLLDGWPVSNDVERIAKDFCSDMWFLILDDFRKTYGLDLADIDSLSALPYEKSRCRGKLLFVPKAEIELDECLSTQIRAGEDITLNRGKQIRKLLAGAGDNTLLLQRTDAAYSVRGFCQPTIPDLHGFLIHILSAGDWEINYYFGGETRGLFRFTSGFPQVVSDPVDRAFIALTEEFPLLKDNRNVKSQIYHANKQSHGTALVYLNFQNGIVNDFINRLFECKRALKVQISNNQDLATLSAMDGGILIDSNTTKVAYVATIVDGYSISDGLQDKGARHNSIFTFVSNLAALTEMNTNVVCALVFSEDGGITIFRGSQIVEENIKYHIAAFTAVNNQCKSPSLL